MIARLRHPLVVAGLVELLIVLPLLVLDALPWWQLRQINVAAPGEYLSPRSWSPDGSRVIFGWTDDFVVVRASDGAVLRSFEGSWPTWVDDNTIDALRDIGQVQIGEFRTELVRIEVSTGISTSIVLPLGAARLVGGGLFDLAATNVVGDTETVVLDPVSGRRRATLPGVRALAWRTPGILIAKASEPALQSYGQQPASLLRWTAAGGLEPIGDGLVEVRDEVVVSPSGHALACVCAPRELVADRSARSIYVLPLDGSVPVEIAPYVEHSPTGNPLVAWLDDDSLVFADGAGIHQVEVGPAAERAPPLDLTRAAAGTPAPRRVYRIGDSLALTELYGHGPTGLARLTVFGPTGQVTFRTEFRSWNAAYLSIHPRSSRAVVASDPTGGELRLFVLERR